MKQYRIKQIIRPQANIEKRCRLISVKAYLAGNGRVKTFNVSMSNPNNGKRLTYYGGRIGLIIYGNIGYLIERKK